VAPFDHDSGQLKAALIAGGRRRPRRLIYLPALSAKRCDPDQKAFAQRLAERGKPAKLIIVAVMRRLIEAANLVLASKNLGSEQPQTNMVLPSLRERRSNSARPVRMDEPARRSD